MRISERLPSFLDSDLAPVAYGSWALPKLVLELQQPEAPTRQRALAALCDLAYDPEKAYQAINNGKSHGGLIKLRRLCEFTLLMQKLTSKLRY